MYEPDWKAFYTLAEAEREFNGFEFKGAGWYETTTDTMLVIEVDYLSVVRDEETLFAFWFWDSPDARKMFADSVSHIIHMPVRTRA